MDTKKYKVHTYWSGSCHQYNGMLSYKLFMLDEGNGLKVCLMYDVLHSPLKPASTSMLPSISPVTVRACFTFRLVSLGRPRGHEKDTTEGKSKTVGDLTCQPEVRTNTHTCAVYHTDPSNSAVST